jgi:hypothetical protein
MIIFRAVAVIAIGLATAGFDGLPVYPPIAGVLPPSRIAVRAGPVETPMHVPIYAGH